MCWVRTVFILRLIPTTIASYVLRLTALMVSAAIVVGTPAAKHLVEEAELCGYGPDEGCEKEEECGDSWHFGIWIFFCRPEKRGT